MRGENLNGEVALKTVINFERVIDETYGEEYEIITVLAEEAEEWEKLADRAHTLEEKLRPLRERLVSWKQMEVW